MPESLVSLQPQLVSPLCGIVRDFRRIHKDPSEPLVPFIYRAELSDHLFQGKEGTDAIHCSGKGFSDEEARTSALGEAAERYGGSCQPRSGVLHRRRGDLDGASLDPRALVLYADEQYAHLPYSPYRDTTEIGWLPGRRWGDPEPVWVPAVSALLAYEVRHRDEYLCPLSSNGLAAGPSIEAAILSGLYEVVERDAFLSTWCHRLDATRVAPEAHPDPDVRALCASHARRGVRMELYRLRVDHPVHVFLGLGVQASGEGPAAVVGLGASLDPAQSARGALLEVAQVRPALRIRMRDEAEAMARMVEDPSLVRRLQDHDLLYASREMLPAFDVLRGSPSDDIDWSPFAAPDAASRLRFLAAYFSDAGSVLHHVDLTPPDLAALGIHVARAILPDFQPIHFGHAEQRLGGRRFFEMPARLGLAPPGTRRAARDLNPLPHPLS